MVGASYWLCRHVGSVVMPSLSSCRRRPVSVSAPLMFVGGYRLRGNDGGMRGYDGGMRGYDGGMRGYDGGGCSCGGAKIQKPASCGFLYLAEREGFEPSLGLTLNTLSRRAPSATQPPLQIFHLAIRAAFSGGYSR